MLATAIAAPLPMSSPRLAALLWPTLLLMIPQSLHAQAIQSRGAERDPGAQPFVAGAPLPVPALTAIAPGNVALRSGLFRERRELAKAYVLRLQTANLLQNHLLEAGVRIDRPYEQMHQGWESPHGQLRGHFAGHWLSAAAHFSATDHDPFLTARVREVVRELQRCQQLNHGQWVGSIPEKYFALLAEGRPVWSPQYTLHKTLMGLLDAYRVAGDPAALTVLGRAADWYEAWTEGLVRAGRGEVVYHGECAGMLELWADLYAVTRDARYLALAGRYARPDLFSALLAGRDPLSNDHANASIPWIQGAARLYEVTGEVRYREIVEAFWRQAVETRGMFATTGSNAGEFWVPPGQFGRFLGSRTQEHCTVYNMIRVAEFLFRWTGEARYADYIERALYNGILAQQHPGTGLVAYFLPLQPGAKKQWGTETHDFWCCHGTLVQAQALFEDLIYYRSADGVTVGQFIPSQAALGPEGGRIRIGQRFDPGDRADFSRADDLTHAVLELELDSDETSPWTLRVRQPAWAAGAAEVAVDGQAVAATVTPSGFIELTRSWRAATVRIAFPKRVTREPLPGDARRFALLDGPVVLAALTGTEPEMQVGEVPTPRYEHQYVDGRDWQTGHYLVRTRQGTIAVRPLYEVGEEAYSVYFASP